jgi:hypothetical protein
MKILVPLMCVLIVAPSTAAYAAAENHAHTDAVATYNADGTIVYDGEYEFRPPPSPWELIKGHDTSNFVFGFYRKDPGEIQMESTFFAYDVADIDAPHRQGIGYQRLTARMFHAAI